MHTRTKQNIKHVNPEVMRNASLAARAVLEQVSTHLVELHDAGKVDKSMKKVLTTFLKEFMSKTTNV